MLGIAQQKMIDVKISKEARTSIFQNKLKRTKIEQKFASGLSEVVAQYKLNGNTLQPKPGAPKIQSVGDDQPSLAQVDTKDRVHVYLHVTGKNNTVASVVKALKAKKITVESSNELMKLIQVWATPAQLNTAAALASVGYVDLITPPEHSTGPVNSQGVSRMRSDVMQSLTGADGNGIKVGVMSDDCGSTENLVNPRVTNGELANGANAPVILDDSWGGSRSHEGLAMMEIVQDVAPLAKLYYATAFTGLANFANNVNALAAAGCRVITDDIIYFAEPVFEDGPLSTTIDNVCTANNVVYTSASTNFGNNNTYYFTYNNLAGQTIGNLGGGYNVENFDGAGDFQNQITVNNGQTVFVSLHWDDKYGASANDFDIYLVNSTNTVALAAATGGQNGTQNPYEQMSFTNSSGVAQTYQVIITRFATSAGDPNATPRMRLFVFRNSSMEYTNKTTSTLGHPTASKGIGVGAIDVTQNNYNAIEGFSSQGPTNIIDFSVAGSRNVSSTRIKPDLSCFDGGVTSVPGFNPFYGTSAAAPHAAGVAAQLLTLYPGLTGAQARAALLAGCIDYGAAGADNVFGAGRLDAFKTIALQRAASAPNTFASGFVSPATAITDNNAAGINSVLTMTAPCTAITPDSVYVSVVIDGHNKAGDLKITLKSPDNTTITLMDRPVSTAGNGTGKNPNIVLGDVAVNPIQTANPAGSEEFGFYIPANVISSNAGFRGHAISGNWTLNVSDNAAGNTGTLKDWGLMMVEGLPTPPSLVINWAPPFIFPNDHTMRNITVSNSLSGGCSPSIQLLSISSNESDFTADLGDVASDIQGATLGTNDLAFQLRSEALSTGNGRFYTVKYRITDVAGYQRDTTFAIPAFATPGRVDPSVTIAAASGTVTLGVAPSPNPLLSSSVISYTITVGTASAVPVLLTVLNNRGKWVRNLDYSSRAPGTYNVTFDGNGADGTPLPNGVYAYQLAIGAPYNSLNTGVVIINRP